MQRLSSSVAAQALLIAILSRVMLAGVSWYTLRVFPSVGPNADLGPVIGGWSIWDTGYYMRIALEGYVTDDPSVPAFFPLYPLSMRLVLELLGLPLTYNAAAWVSVGIANVCFLIAVPLFARFVESLQGVKIALFASVLLCVSPFSFFFNAGYTESVFLLLVILSLGSSTRRRWLLAALFAGLASATRITGLVLLPAILLMAWRERAGWRELLGVAVLSPSGLLGFAGFLWWKLDDPLAFLTAQERWSGREFRINFFIERIFVNPSHLLYGGPDYHDLYVPVIFLNVVLWTMSLGTLWWVFRWTNLAIGVFTALLVVSHGWISWISLGRYLLPSIGVYIVIARVVEGLPASQAVKIGLVACSSILLTMLLILFGHGYWII